MCFEYKMYRCEEKALYFIAVIVRACVTSTLAAVLLIPKFVYKSLYLYIVICI